MKNIESLHIEIRGAVDSSIKICNTEHVRMYVLHVTQPESIVLQLGQE